MLSGNECILHGYTGGLRLQRPNLPCSQYLHRHECCRIDEVYAPEVDTRARAGRHGSCRLVDRTPSPPLHRPSRQLVSVADYAEAGNEAVAGGDIAVAEAAGDIAGTAEDVIGKVFAEISEVDVGLVACQMTSRSNTMLLVGFALA